MFGIVHSTDVVKKLNKIDKLILLLACVGHGKPVLFLYTLFGIAEPFLL